MSPTAHLPAAAPFPPQLAPSLSPLGKAVLPVLPVTARIATEYDGTACTSTYCPVHGTVLLVLEFI